MPPEQSLPSGTITLLFTDIEGSTRLLQQLGGGYTRVLAESRKLLRKAFKHWNGYEVDTQGDAFFVVFPSATDALCASIMAQSSLAEYNWPEDLQVRVRIGLHTGEPEPAEEGYVGLDVHRAARIMSAGHGGQILLSQETYDLVESGLPDKVSLRDLGEYHLKDIEGLTRLFQVEIEGLANDFPLLKTPGMSIPRRSIPIPPTPLIGRDRELLEIRKHLQHDSQRLLTLTGTAGVGKTRLALQAALELTEKFLGDIFFIDLAQVRNTEGFMTAITQALDLREESNLPILEQIKEWLHDKRVLLVLDNFEQLVFAGSLLSTLLASCPKLKLLVTSRTMLHIQGEQVFDVLPLLLPNPKRLPKLEKLQDYPAIELFVERARAIQPDFQLNETNAPAVAEICARLDGLPLAIELAAARCRYFAPPVLLARLEQGLGVLSRQAPDLPERQQTLRAAITWSYELLEPTEQQVFRRLSIFRNGCTLEAAEQVCSSASLASDDIVAILEMLVDKNLLRQSGPDVEEPRFWQLQTLQEYGHERLEQSQELETIQAAHARYYLAWTKKIAPFLTGSLQAEWLERLDRDYENVRIALEWIIANADGESALQMCLSIRIFWEIRGYIREASAFLDRALQTSKEIESPLRADALHAAGFFALMQDDAPKAEGWLYEGQLLFRKTGDKTSMATILRLQGHLAAAKNNYKMGNRLLSEALTLYASMDNYERVARTREDLAQIAILQCDYKKARQLLEQNIAYLKESGEQFPHPLFHLSTLFFLSGENLEEAWRLSEESLEMFKRVQNRRLIGHIYCHQANILLYTENLTDAQSLLTESMSIFSELGERSGTAMATITSAQLAFLQTDLAKASSLYKDCLAQLKIIEAKDLIARCLEGWGEVLVTQREPRRATQLWGKAAALRAELVAPIPPIYRITYGEAVSKARNRLGARNFQAAWLEGPSIEL